MRLVRLIAATCVLFLVRPVFAQEWTEYKNLPDRFVVVAPGEPKTETITWDSEYGAVFPGTVYRWQAGPNRYSVTVIDYSDSEAIHARTKHNESFQGPYWHIDIMASIAYAATRYRQRPGVKVTFDAWHYIDLVTGHQLQLTNPDESRAFVGIYLHENRLYILDATVAKGMPPPIMFQQNVQFLDAKGEPVRYRTYYFNKPPEPRLGRRGGGAGPGAQGQNPPQ